MDLAGKIKKVIYIYFKSFFIYKHSDILKIMSRLQEFITRIRNTKTQAEERAEYQKEMAVIR